MGNHLSVVHGVQHALPYRVHLELQRCNRSLPVYTGFCNCAKGVHLSFAAICGDGILWALQLFSFFDNICVLLQNCHCGQFYRCPDMFISFVAFAKPAGGYSPCKLLAAVTAFLTNLAF